VAFVFQNPPAHYDSVPNLPESFQYNELAKNSPEKCQSHLLAHLCSFREGQQHVSSFPTMTVITLTTTAPGYEPSQKVMKPHYRRNVTLTIDIPLAPMPTQKD
jgi:hypothetical protein